MEGNDDEPLSFSSIAALTANVIQYLRLEKQKEDKQEQDESDTHRNEEQSDKAQSDYVAIRLRDIAAFERKARGKN